MLVANFIYTSRQNHIVVSLITIMYAMGFNKGV